MPRKSDEIYANLGFVAKCDENGRSGRNKLGNIFTCNFDINLMGF